MQHPHLPPSQLSHTPQQPSQQLPQQVSNQPNRDRDGPRHHHQYNNNNNNNNRNNFQTHSNYRQNPQQHLGGPRGVAAAALPSQQIPTPAPPTQMVMNGNMFTQQQVMQQQQYNPAT